MRVLKKKTSKVEFCNILLEKKNQVQNQTLHLGSNIHLREVCLEPVCPYRPAVYQSLLLEVLVS